MLTALLLLAGVDLVVILAFFAIVLARRRWVQGRAGVFPGVIRVAHGGVDGLRSTWRRGYGRWERDMLIWYKAPLFFRTELVATDGLEVERSTRKNEVKRLGEPAVLVTLRSDEALVDVAADASRIELLRGPYPKPADDPGS